MPIYQVIVLAIVQGLAELLPVSSSAHVVVAEKLMGLDPSTPQMTLLLVMLHTGTMFAVIAYFWKQWMQTYFSSADAFKRFAVRVVWATLLTGIVGEGLIKVIEHTLFKGQPKAVIEDLFGRLDLVAPALACAGILILIAGLREKKGEVASEKQAATSLTGSITRRPSGNVTMSQAGWMGFVQGLALPFRGFSRSGVTISAGMLTGAAKERAERFSFAHGGGHHSAGDWPRGDATAEGDPRGRGHRCADRSARHACVQPAGRGVRVPGWPGCAEVAEQLAGERAVVSLRDLLSGGKRSRVLPAYARILTAQPEKAGQTWKDSTGKCATSRTFVETVNPSVEHRISEGTRAPTG